MKKRIFIVAMLLGTIAVTGCKKDETKTNDPNDPTNPINVDVNATIYGLKISDLEELDVRVNGEINPDTPVVEKVGAGTSKYQRSVVSFSRFPVSVGEFQKVREQIGTTPQGAVALQLMATEMYMHNKAIGLACLKLNHTNTNFGTFAELLKNKKLENTSPFQIATHLKGATRSGGYNPTEPYTVIVKINPNFIQKGEYLYSDNYGAPLVTFQYDTHHDVPEKERYSDTQFNIQVVKTQLEGEPSQNKYFTVSDCPSLAYEGRKLLNSSDYKGLKPFGKIRK